MKRTELEPDLSYSLMSGVRAFGGAGLWVCVQVGVRPIGGVAHWQCGPVGCGIVGDIDWHLLSAFSHYPILWESPQKFPLA